MIIVFAILTYLFLIQELASYIHSSFRFSIIPPYPRKAVNTNFELFCSDWIRTWVSASDCSDWIRTWVSASDCSDWIRTWVSTSAADPRHIARLIWMFNNFFQRINFGYILMKFFFGCSKYTKIYKICQHNANVQREREREILSINLFPLFS